MCKLTFYYSSMNSGKSLSLLTKNYMLREKGFKTILMKPAVDTRSDSTITTRLGLSEKCIVFDDNPSNHIMVVNNQKPDYILVDESQFMTKNQVWDLSDLVDNWHINVYCYGLKLDWQGNFFEGSEALFKLADDLIALENICKYNQGAPAFFHIKNGGSTDSVEVGAEELYESVSRKYWKQWWEEK